MCTRGDSVERDFPGQAPISGQPVGKSGKAGTKGPPSSPDTWIPSNDGVHQLTSKSRLALKQIFSAASLRNRQTASEICWHGRWLVR